MKITSVEGIYKLVSQTEYGWLDINGKKHYKLNMEEYKEKYILQSPEEVIKNKIGVCWDQVELERYYLEKLKIKCESYIIVNKSNENFRVHTFIIYYKNSKVYWFEHAWGSYKGIHEFENKQKIFGKIKETFINEELKNKNYVDEEIHIYKYFKPSYHINYYEFIDNALANDNTII